MVPASARIVGAGFSGLTLAYYLKKRFPHIALTVQDALPSVGGMLQSELTAYGVREPAANAILDSEQLRDLCRELKVDLLDADSTIKRASFYRDNQVKSWPLTFFESLRLVPRALKFFSQKKNARPVGAESVDAWGERVFTRAFTDYLMSPALGGIYATPSDSLSASLILDRFFSSAKKKKGPRSVAPAKGMRELCLALQDYLATVGVKFELGKKLETLKSDEALIFCGSLESAKKLLGGLLTAPTFATLPTVSTTSTTLFFDSLPSDGVPNSFGVLFPAIERRRFLGVLFNTKIFRRPQRFNSETWITNEQPVNDAQFIQQILVEREHVFGCRQKPLDSLVTRWPNALPLYGEALRSFLLTDWPQLKAELSSRQIYLHGNYLGKLGLSGLLVNSELMANEFKVHWGQR